MTRRTTIAALAGVFAANVPLQAQNLDPIREIFEGSLKDKKGVMVYLKGQSVGGIVTKLDGEFVELRSREYEGVRTFV